MFTFTNMYKKILTDYFFIVNMIFINDDINTTRVNRNAAYP